MYGLILAGGAGTRLWPKSRAYWPKFLLKFGRHSLLQQCYLRLSSFIPKDKIFIVANVEHKFLIKENISDLGVAYPDKNILVEPCSRNTAPAIAFASKYILDNYGDGTIIACPSDHLIKDNKMFSEVVRRSEPFAARGEIVIFGIAPTRPETGYGYIKFGAPLSGGVYKVEKFVEKPSRRIAALYLKSRDYHWNAGIFLFKASSIISEVKMQMPGFHAILSRLEYGHPGAFRKRYGMMPNVSIDYAVIEKTKKIVAARLDIVWDDLGDWNSLTRVYKSDPDGNVFEGKTVDVGSRNVTVVGDKRIIATVGLENLIIIDTEDALLVVNKSEVQNVRDVVAGMKGKEETLYHKTVLRPWGEYSVLEKGRDYKVKIIHVLPGKKLSLQKHMRRSERWIVVNGVARVVKNKKRIIARKGRLVELPIRTLHRMENAGREILSVIEISRGRYIGEDDIIRIDDDFNRM